MLELACSAGHETDMILGLATFGAATVISVVGILSTQIRRTRVAAYEARLKQLMLERGMSVEEIERVMLTGSGVSSRSAKKAARRWKKQNPF